jgi:translation elongation factor P/translation initiation factor 5A
MPGGSVYKDHTFNKETAQYIARDGDNVSVIDTNEIY